MLFVMLYVSSMNDGTARIGIRPPLCVRSDPVIAVARNLTPDNEASPDLARRYTFAPPCARIPAHYLSHSSRTPRSDAYSPITTLEVQYYHMCVMPSPIALCFPLFV